MTVSGKGDGKIIGNFTPSQSPHHRLAEPVAKHQTRAACGAN
jgi:hypothetical protein